MRHGSSITGTLVSGATCRHPVFYRRIFEGLNCMGIVVKCNNVLLDETSNNNRAQERKYCDFCCDYFIPF